MLPSVWNRLCFDIGLQQSRALVVPKKSPEKKPLSTSKMLVMSSFLIYAFARQHLQRLITFLRFIVNFSLVSLFYCAARTLNILCGEISILLVSKKRRDARASTRMLDAWFKFGLSRLVYSIRSVCQLTQNTGYKGSCSWPRAFRSLVGIPVEQRHYLDQNVPAPKSKFEWLTWSKIPLTHCCRDLYYSRR